MNNSSNLKAISIFGIRANRKKWKDSIEGYMFIAPYFILYGLFFIYPVVLGFLNGFSEINMLSNTSKFIGFDNYRELLSDRHFTKSLLNTVIFVVCNVPVIITTGLFIAIILHRIKRGKVFFRATFVYPYFITGAAIGILASFLFANAGPVNGFLGFFGFRGIKWLGETIPAWLTILFTTFWWRIGFQVVVFLAGLENIPVQLYEAAEIDGASRWKILTKVTIPMLKPVIMFLCIMRIIDSFRVFAQVYLVTEGGPYGTTRVIVQYLYEQAFKFYRPGYAAAIGWVLFIIVFIITLLQFKLFGNPNPEAE